MANPVNSIDIHDPAYATTHALMVVKKNDRSGRESTPAQQGAVAGESWGDFNDDEFLALRAQGQIPLRYTDATTTATPSAQDFMTVPDGGVLEVETIAVGQVGANDCVYRKVTRTFERDGGTVQTLISSVGTATYSSGGTLSTATADIIISGTMARLQVTGEASKTIAWRLYTRFTVIF